MSAPAELWHPVRVAIPVSVARPIAKVRTYLVPNLGSIAVIMLYPLSGLNPNILDEMRFAAIA